MFHTGSLNWCMKTIFACILSGRVFRNFGRAGFDFTGLDDLSGGELGNEVLATTLWCLFRRSLLLEEVEVIDCIFSL